MRKNAKWIIYILILLGFNSCETRRDKYMSMNTSRIKDMHILICSFKNEKLRYPHDFNEISEYKLNHLKFNKWGDFDKCHLTSGKEIDWIYFKPKDDKIVCLFESPEQINGLTLRIDTEGRVSRE